MVLSTLLESQTLLVLELFSMSCLPRWILLGFMFIKLLSFPLSHVHDNVLLQYALCNVSNVCHHKKLILPMSRLLQDSSGDTSRPRGSGSSNHVTSPPPISLGRKVEVDLKEKQKKFEGLDKQAVEVIINSVTLIPNPEFVWRNARLTRELISPSLVPMFHVSRIESWRESQDEILRSITFR